MQIADITSLVVCGGVPEQNEVFCVTVPEQNEVFCQIKSEVGYKIIKLSKMNKTVLVNRPGVDQPSIRKCRSKSGVLKV